MNAPAIAPALRAWIETSIGRDARVVDMGRLSGGLTSHITELRVQTNGEPAHCVLRSFDADAEHQDWRRRSIESETAVLDRLSGTDLPVPRLIASTTDTSIGGPALLMTRVPGQMLLTPRDPDDWLRQMAGMLAQIHALPAEGQRFDIWNKIGELIPPVDATRPEVWRAAFNRAAGPPPPGDDRFIHRDYQHFNLLWENDRLSGVVDWSGACVGPPDIDVGHCRLNLALLFSADAADRFRDCYEAASGRRVEAYWDLHALLSYGPDWKYFLPLQIDGRAQLNVHGMTARMEQVLERTLRRNS